MKSVRNKKANNSSFLSNNDLLQNLRKNINSSFKLLTRESSFSKFKQIPKKICLIQKKNYETKSKDNKENESNFNNAKIMPSPKNMTHRQKPKTQQCFDQQFQRVIKELNFIYDQINTEEIQLKMILNKNIRRIKDLFCTKSEAPANKTCVDSKQQQYKEKVDALTHKIEKQNKKILNYRKQCEDLKDQLSLYEAKIQKLQVKLEQQHKTNSSAVFPFKQPKILSTVKSQINVSNSEKTTKRETQIKTNCDQTGQIEILQNIIQTQQELISKQMTDFEAENEEFLRMLQIQAFKIEELMDQKQGFKQTSSTKMFSSEKRSSRRDLTSYSNSSSYTNPFNQLINYSSPHKVEDFLMKINKKKKAQGDFSICLY